MLRKKDKKYGKVMSMLGIALVLAGCGNNSIVEESNNVIVKVASETESPTISNLVDLTLLGDTMLYAELYNITVSPENYLDKTIKINGVYQEGYWEESGLYYDYVVIEDAAACCQTGIEFLWEQENTILKDGDQIQVTGVFESYEELGETFQRIVATSVVIN